MLTGCGAVVVVVVVVVVWCRVEAVRMATTAKQFVCTETFKAGLTSFFIQKDSKQAFAEDQSELCEMCAKVMRLAYLYSNDMTTSDRWATALQANACSFVGSARKGMDHPTPPSTPLHIFGTRRSN